MPRESKTETSWRQKVPKKKTALRKNSAKKGTLLRVPKAEQKTRHNVHRDRKTETQFGDQKVSKQKTAQRKKNAKKGDTACPKSGAKNKAQRAQRTQDGNILETKSPQEKNSAAKKHRQKRGHDVSQKTRHDLPRTRKPKTHLGVPRARHPPQLPTQLLPGCRLILNITGETKHRAAKSRRDDASQKKAHQTKTALKLKRGGVNGSEDPKAQQHGSCGQSNT